jgi:hypothetical protein
MARMLKDSEKKKRNATPVIGNILNKQNKFKNKETPINPTGAGGEKFLTRVV